MKKLYTTTPEITQSKQKSDYAAFQIENAVYYHREPSGNFAYRSNEVRA